MEALLDRYLDGELTEAEAAAFLAALAEDPGLERELRSRERALAVYAEAWREGPADGFVDRVADEVAAGGRTGAAGRGRAGAASGRSWPHLRVLALAATVVVCFGLGLVADDLLAPGRDPAAGGPGGSPAILSGTGDLPGGANLAAAGGAEPVLLPVRLVYAPTGEKVGSVAVAGDFNGWDPQATPLRQRDGIWTAVLLLPPGDHEYMFVLDGKEWRTDPLALQTRDDGFGRRNAVLDLSL